MNPFNNYLSDLQEKYGHRVFSRKLKFPPTATYIGRGSIFGNKYTHIPNIPNTILVENRTVAVIEYRKKLVKNIIARDEVLIQRIKELLGLNVVCYCNNGTNNSDPKHYCHGLILLAACDYLNNITI